MVESNLTLEKVRLEAPSRNGDAETYALAAALAAALVTYQQTEVSRNGNGYRAGSRTAWRLMSRWGQLQGYL